MKHELSPFFNLYNLKCIWVKSDLVKISVRQRRFTSQGHVPFQMEPYVASFTPVCSHNKTWQCSWPCSPPSPVALHIIGSVSPSFLPSRSFPLSFRERKQNRIPLLGPVAQFSSHCWLLLPLGVSSFIFPSARFKKTKIQRQFSPWNLMPTKQGQVSGEVCEALISSTKIWRDTKKLYNRDM